MLDIPISEGVDNHLAESGRYGAQSVKQGRSWFDLASCTHIARSYNAENGRSGSGGDEDTLWPSGQSLSMPYIQGIPESVFLLERPDRKGGVVLCSINCEATGDHLLDSLL